MVRSVAGALGVAWVAVACGGSTQRSQSSFQQAQPGQAPYGAQPGQPPPPPGQPPPPAQPPQQPPQPATQQPGQVAPLGAILSDPSALQNILAGALAASSASLTALTGGEGALIEQGIRLTAQRDAKGMRAEGPVLSAKLAPGGHAEASVSLKPGGCYSVIGFGGPGVFQFQINLISAPPLPPQVLAQSDADGNDPSVGPNEKCIKNPYPLPMALKVDMHVVKGQGLVGAQLFRK
jgi:hypothetical protein